jgi:hypothetical protein
VSTVSNLARSSDGRHVAQDVRQLEGDAERVGQVGGLRWVLARAEDAERQPADRARHAAAVVQEIVERLVARAAHVRHAAVDELAERRDGHREVPLHVGQREQDRVIRAGAGEVEDGMAGLLEGGDLLVRRHRAVADVVDPAGEGVDDREPAPLALRQQPDAVREVPGL